MRRLLPIAPLVLTLTITAPSWAVEPGEPDRSTEVEPTVPEASHPLRAALQRVQGLSSVEVSDEAGVLVLEGEVDTTQQREVAEEIARRARPDALYVDNRLSVGAGAPAQAPDVALRERIEGIFDQVSAFSDIEVTVGDGVVHLRGEAYDGEVSEEAVDLVRGLDGVLYVENEVRDVTEVGARISPALQDLVDRGRALVDRLPLAAIALLLVGVVWLLSGRIARWLSGRVLPGRPLLGLMLTRVVRGLVILGAVVLAFDLLGITGMVGAVLGTVGVAGIAVGFAFQDIVENLLAGFLLGLQRPFSQNDVVRIGEHEGKVVRLTVRETVLMTIDGNHLRVPNAIVYKSASLNFTKNPLRRFDFVVGLGMDVPLAEAQLAARDLLTSIDGVLSEPRPSVLVDAIGDSSMQVHLYAWVDQRTHDFFAITSEAIRLTKREFEERDYDMPEPTYRVAMRQVDAAEKPVVAEPASPTMSTRAGDPIDEQIEAERRSEGRPDLLDG